VTLQSKRVTAGLPALRALFWPNLATPCLGGASFIPMGTCHHATPACKLNDWSPKVFECVAFESSHRLRAVFYLHHPEVINNPSWNDSIVAQVPGSSG
jgi:hypothetical protein